MFMDKHSKKLRKAFRLSGIAPKIKYNKKVYYNYPKILDKRFKEDKDVFVFRLPHGVDPELTHKNEHVFRSMYGDMIELKGEFTVALTVFKKEVNTSYDYDFEQLQPVMKKHSLPVIAGVDTKGKFWCYDMTKNPHLLIAGETGSGKSVMLRAILTSLIQHKRTGLKLFLADMKRSEFHLFRRVDIVEAVMTKKKDLIRCVEWFHKQLEERGDLLDAHELSHVNDLPNPPDYLVLCIDEFSVIREEKETLDQIADLTALGRALGIYVILSTQRPDSKVVDGLLKANLTVRYAFRHADKLNSRITLGDGATVDASSIPEEHRGKFFMRFNGFQLLQSPLLEVEEAKEILETYKTRLEKRPFSVAENVVSEQEGTEVTDPLQIGGSENE